MKLKFCQKHILMEFGGGIVISFHLYSKMSSLKTPKHRTTLDLGMNS